MADGCRTAAATSPDRLFLRRIHDRADFLLRGGTAFAHELLPGFLLASAPRSILTRKRQRSSLRRSGFNAEILRSMTCGPPAAARPTSTTMRGLQPDVNQRTSDSLVRRNRKTLRRR